MSKPWTYPKSFTSKSGAYIHSGQRDFQIYASIPRSDSLIAVLELDMDCRGQVYTYFMRGGITEARMTIDEYRRGVIAMQELLQAALEEWPTKMKLEE